MKKKNIKKIVKVDKVDCYIARYREDLKLQDELERRRETGFLNLLFKRESTKY